MNAGGMSLSCFHFAGHWGHSRTFNLLKLLCIDFKRMFSKAEHLAKVSSNSRSQESEGTFPQSLPKSRQALCSFLLENYGGKHMIILGASRHPEGSLSFAAHVMQNC